MNQSTVLPGVAVRPPIGNNLAPLVRLIPGLALSAALAVAATQLGRISWFAAALVRPGIQISPGFA